MNLFRAVPLILKWLPHVVTAVSLVEVLSGDKAGSEKKAAAMKWLHELSSGANLPWGDAAISVVNSLIDAAVSVAHILGVFQSRETKIDSDLNPDNPIDRRVIDTFAKGLYNKKRL